MLSIQFKVTLNFAQNKKAKSIGLHSKGQFSLPTEKAETAD